MFHTLVIFTSRSRLPAADLPFRRRVVVRLYKKTEVGYSLRPIREAEMFHPLARTLTQIFVFLSFLFSLFFFLLFLTDHGVCVPPLPSLLPSLLYFYHSFGYFFTFSFPLLLRLSSVYLVSRLHKYFFPFCILVSSSFLVLIFIRSQSHLCILFSSHPLPLSSSFFLLIRHQSRLYVFGISSPSCTSLFVS